MAISHAEELKYIKDKRGLLKQNLFNDTKEGPTVASVPPTMRDFPLMPHVQVGGAAVVPLLESHPLALRSAILSVSTLMISFLRLSIHSLNFSISVLTLLGNFTESMRRMRSSILGLINLSSSKCLERE